MPCTTGRASGGRDGGPQAELEALGPLGRLSCHLKGCRLPCPGGDSHSDLTQVAVLVLDHMCVLGAVEDRHRLGVIPESDVGFCRVNGDCGEVDNPVEHEHNTGHLGCQGRLGWAR